MYIEKVFPLCEFEYVLHNEPSLENPLGRMCTGNVSPQCELEHVRLAEPSA